MATAEPVRANLPAPESRNVSMLNSAAKSIVRHTLPVGVRSWLRVRMYGRDHTPGIGSINFGDFRRLAPISRWWGFDRGVPIDRYYLEAFLEAHAESIRGRVLEIADDIYTRRFGGSRVTQSDVLHAAAGNPQATITGDLSSSDHIPSESFDCIICTQTLMLIYDFRAAIRTMHRILRPGGVLLVTVPGVMKISRYDMDRWGDHWRFTSASAQRSFEELFGDGNVEVTAKGNVFAACSFLQGVSAHELSEDELNYNDPDFEVSIGISATKSA